MAFGLTGCAFGPTALARNQVEYNQVIKTTTDTAPRWSLGVETRSLLHALYFVSHGIDVPAEHAVLDLSVRDRLLTCIAGTENARADPHLPRRISWERQPACGSLRPMLLAMSGFIPGRLKRLAT